MKNIIAAAIMICLLTAVTTALAGGGVGVNKGVYPPTSHPFGKSYGQWSADWWKWAYSLPVDRNPFFEEGVCYNDANGQSGPVWFLTGVINVSGTAERTCAIPADKALFFPILNIECATLEGNGSTLEELRGCTESYMDVIVKDSVFCEVDGIAIQSMDSYQAESGLFTYGPLPENNVLASFGFDAPAGATSLSYSDGYWVMLRPFAPGQHTIHFGGTFGPPFNFTLDITYHLDVFAPPKIVEPNQVFEGKTLAEWLTTYWRWALTGSDPDQSKVGSVQLMPLPAGALISGTGTPEDPALYRGQLEFTLPAGTPFVLPQYGWYGERYNNGLPDDPPFPDEQLMGGVDPYFTIDGTAVITKENQADFYVPYTAFDPIIEYAEPTSYGSIAAIYFQGVGMICAGLEPGVHVIRLYEPYIIPGLWGVIYDNTWIVTVPNDN